MLHISNIQFEYKNNFDIYGRKNTDLHLKTRSTFGSFTLDNNSYLSYTEKRRKIIEVSSVI